MKIADREEQHAAQPESEEQRKIARREAAAREAIITNERLAAEEAQLKAAAAEAARNLAEIKARADGARAPFTETSVRPLHAGIRRRSAKRTGSGISPNVSMIRPASVQSPVWTNDTRRPSTDVATRMGP